MIQNSNTITNGRGAAAILAAGLACFLIGSLSLISSMFPAASKIFTFYAPTADISGISTIAIVSWLVVWRILFQTWHNKTVRIVWVNLFAFLMLVVGLFLTCPFFVDFLQGK